MGLGTLGDMFVVVVVVGDGLKEIDGSFTPWHMHFLDCISTVGVIEVLLKFA